MKLSGAGMLVLDRAHNRYELRAGDGNIAKLAGMTISDNFAMVKELCKSGMPIVYEEVLQTIRASGSSDAKLWGTIKAEMAQLKAALLIPAISKSEYFNEPVLLSIFVFGGKLSDDAFSGSDLEFLETVARQASIIIEYAFILEELRRDEQRIISAEKFAALGVMAGSVVGALKGPISNMEKYSQTMSQRFDDPAFRDGFVNDIPRDIMRLDKVVNDLLIYARPMKLNLAPVKLNDLLKKAVDLLKIKEIKEHISVKESFSDIPEIQADPQQMLNALVRMVSYSVAAAKNDVVIQTSPQDGHVSLSIAIPGSVVPKTALQKIFMSYYSPKEGEGGLDLATAAKIIREHGGDVRAESNDIIGTRFTVALPVNSPPVVPARTPSLSPPC
jgi:signal transduction histidine kinase